jgi:polyisoprenoid-binding protein YceI
MTLLRERSKPAGTTTSRSPLAPIGSWTIDPSYSSVSLTWSQLRLATTTGRLHCLGVIHLDDLPPVGVIQFEQPSGLSVLTMALDPASVETGDADLDARLRSPEVFDVQRHRWWMLRSESLEILPTGTWRVMATLTTSGTTSLIELHFDVDYGPSDPDWPVLRGHGVLDRRAFGIASPASTFSRQIRLDLVMRARQVEDPHPRLSTKGEHMHNQHAGLSQQLAAQRISQRHEQAAQARLAQSASQSRRRRHRWWLAPRWWWLLGRRPGAAQPAVRHPHRVS